MPHLKKIRKLEGMLIKRPLIYMFGGFVLGEVLSLIHAAGFIMIIFAGLAGMLAAAGIFTEKGRNCISGLFSGSRGREFLLLLFFFLAGFVRMEGEMKPPSSALLVRNMADEPVYLEGCVSDISWKKDSVSMKLTKSSIYEGGRSYPVGSILLYLKNEEEIIENIRLIRLGMRIGTTGKISECSGPRNPGEFSYASYYRSLKIHYRMFGEGMRITDGRYHPYYDGLYRLRCYAGSILDKVCTETDSGVLKAMLLGDKGQLSDEIRRLYQDSGIAHLLAISGLHISLLGMSVYKGIRRLGAGVFVSFLCSAGLLVSYGILTGLSGSVSRAVFMMLCVFLAEYLGRTYDLLSAAALAGICLLMDAPYLLLQGGFQLSFGAVFAIGGIGGSLFRWMSSEHTWEKTLLTLISVQWGTLPIILYHFFQFPLYGFLLNLVVIPLMAFLVCSGIAGILLGGISMKAGMLSVGAGHFILQFYQWLCQSVQNLPGNLLVLGRPDWKQLAVFYTWMMLVLGLLRSCSNKGSRIVIRWLVLFCGVTVSFLLMVKLPWINDKFQMTFLDVGQGDGIVITAGDFNILIDGGSTDIKDLGKYRLEPYLKSRGISKIDYAFVSHGDMDHISGLVYLMGEARGIRIENLVLPYLGRGDEAYEPLRQLAKQHGVSVYDMSAGDVLSLAGLRISCLYPGKQETADDRNEHSLVLKVDYGNCHVLLTGDMSRKGEAHLLEETGLYNQKELYNIQILKVAHHGSKYSSSEEFLQNIKPRWAILSYGQDNRYGHPHQEVVERMEKQGIQTIHTAWNGAITLISDGERVWWEVFIE